MPGLRSALSILFISTFAAFSLPTDALAQLIRPRTTQSRVCMAAEREATVQFLTIEGAAAAFESQLDDFLDYGHAGVYIDHTEESSGVRFGYLLCDSNVSTDWLLLVYIREDGEGAHMLIHRETDRVFAYNSNTGLMLNAENAKNWLNQTLTYMTLPTM